MNNLPTNPIQQKVLKAIEAGKITMKPRWHFVAKAALLLVGTILLSLTLVYLASFIVFVLFQTGILFAPEFGMPGIQIFIISLPWVLILVTLIFIILLQILIKKYSFGYGKPLMYSALSIFVLIILGSILIIKATSIHKQLFGRAHRQGLPIAGSLYTGYSGEQNKKITAGIITEVHDSGCRVQNLRGDEIEVLITSSTRIIPPITLNEGDEIIIFGERSDGLVQAYGVRRVYDRIHWRPLDPR